MITLRSEDYATIDDLVCARGAIAAPVLFRVRPAELERILPRLRDDDDVCIDGDPPALIEHRLQALGRRTSKTLDALTGLLNRATFARIVAHDLPAALLVVNLDRFKQLNDQLGHLVGDQVLTAAAARTRSAVPADAAIARIGGDTFALALASHHDPHRIAAAILAAFRAAAFPEDARVTASIGLVVRTTEASYEDLVRHADAAMYAAKARGRDRVVEHAERAREARERDGDLELDGFEDVTRVLAERVADVISWRGRRMFQGLREQVDVDVLTGLYSRRYLERRLAFEIEQAATRGAPLAVGLLDVDHFGRVNKEHGWPTGDKVLAEAADRVRHALRGTDWAARYGGEEICIILDGAGIDAARAVLERVRAAVAASPFQTTGGVALPISVSIGCAELAAGETALALVERASTHLLEAKRGGRDRVCG